MVDYLWYILKVSICLAIFYVFFIAVLKRSTFFTLNRIYLILGLILSFTIPILKVSIFKAQSSSVLTSVIRIVSIEPEYTFFQSQNLVNETIKIDFPIILSVIYFIGLSVLLLKFFLSIIRVIRVKNNAEVLRIGKIRIVKTNSFIPFSFLNMIFLPINENNPMIVEHEMAHVRQAHWFDLLLTEIASVLLWFNPFVVLYKSSLKLQHEYLADSSVIERNYQLENYLDCMLMQVKIVSTGGLTSQFYYKTIKKRIIMITKNKTSLKYLGIYFLVLPLVCMILFAFSAGDHSYSLASKTTFTQSDENAPSIYPIDSKKITQTNGYGERINPISKKKDFHYGIDLAAKEGEEIVVTAKGVVIEAKFDTENKKGNYIIIKHSDVYSTFYSHLKDFNVKEGDVVEKGQVIGYVGNTGVSTGSHLHYEVIKSGERVNPKDYLPK
ncbi:MAG TPA: hypothetical protein DIW31_12150 [Bacteroidales bacterium]|nr:hypothetical protein [Bacteroidales bacterium]